MNRLKMSTRIMLILCGINILSIVIIGIISYLFMERTIKDMSKNELIQLTESNYNTINLSINDSIKNYLRGAAEQNKLIIERYYNLVKDKKLSKSNALEIIKDLIISQKIGKTGYSYLLSSKGIIKVHPKSSLVGTNLSEYDFIQQQKIKKQGYVEYLWKNPDEKIRRNKILYMTYFKPWDLIISVTSYKDEFDDLLDLELIRKEILSIKILQTGYIYVLDKKGNAIIHPTYQNQNISEFKDDLGFYFIKEILKTKNGYIEYPWKNPNDISPRMKIVVYKHLASLDWIICSGIYKDEMEHSLNNLKNIVIIFLGFLFIFFVFLIRIYSPALKPIETLQFYAERDPLTGIFNRRTGILYLEKELIQAQKNKNPLIISYLDLNDLKYINDNFGHDTGDELIKNFTSVIIKCLREEDLFCRLGGDEFMIVFDSCSLDTAEKIWKRIEYSLVDTVIKNNLSYKISASCGIVQYDNSRHNNAKELIHEADLKMYENKQIYKNSKKNKSES